MAKHQRPERPDIAPAIFETYMRSYFEGLKGALDEMAPAALTAVLRVLERARLEHRQIFIVGDGGSAATAIHMAGELGHAIDDGNAAVTRFRIVNLCDNGALLAAPGNDLAFEHNFAEQLAALMNAGDVVVVISASGNSPNLIRAAQYARSRGGELVGLLGFGGGTLGTLVDHAVVVSSRNDGLSEDSHFIVQHVLTQYLRRLLWGPARQAAFLDRDGVINERPAPHQYVTSWEQFHWVDGILPLLRGLSDRGFALLVITNQQGVGKGILSAGALEGIHGEMTRTLEREGIALTRVLQVPQAASGTHLPGPQRDAVPDRLGAIGVDRRCRFGRAGRPGCRDRHADPGRRRRPDGRGGHPPCPEGA
jgi:D-sedoheptulose 7-phosphate isomerase